MELRERSECEGAARSRDRAACVGRATPAAGDRLLDGSSSPAGPRCATPPGGRLPVPAGAPPPGGGHLSRTRPSREPRFRWCSTSAPGLLARGRGRAAVRVERPRRAPGRARRSTGATRAMRAGLAEDVPPRPGLACARCGPPRSTTPRPPPDPGPAPRRGEAIELVTVASAAGHGMMWGPGRGQRRRRSSAHRAHGHGQTSPNSRAPRPLRRSGPLTARRRPGRARSVRPRHREHAPGPAPVGVGADMYEPETPCAPEGVRTELGPRLLGLEDAAERGRARPVHRARRGGPLDGEALRAAPRAAPAQRARLLRRARRAGHARARRTAATRNTPATDLFLDRAKPSYIGGMLEMANARLYRFWGSLTEGLRTGEPQNEAKARRRLLRGALRRPGAAARSSPRAMTGISIGRGAGDRAEVPLAATTGPSIDVGCAEGARAGPGRAGARRTSPAAASTCPPSGRSSTTTSPRFGLARAPAASPPATSSPTRCPRRTCS